MLVLLAQIPEKGVLQVVQVLQAVRQRLTKVLTNTNMSSPLKYE